MAIDKKQVEEIVRAVGGKENIEAATHCVTRLRFALYDESKVDTESLDQNDLVKGQFSSQGQFQVVIGPGLVDKVYDEMIQITGGDRSSKDDVKAVAGKKQNPIQRAIKTLSDIFIPILPAIITAGLLLGINNILTGPGIFFDKESLVDVYPAWKDLASIINTIASTAFTFLPALIGWAAVKRFGGSPLLGIVLGLILVHPDLLSAYGYADAVNDGTVPTWNLFGWEIEKIGYQGQVLPVLVSAYLLAKMEIFLNKRVHDSIKLLVVAPVTLLITGFLAFTIIGPVTFAIANAITSGLIYVYDSYAALGGLIYGGLYALLVITGMHHTFLAVDVQLIGSQGGTFLWPMLALSNIAQGSAALAMMLVLREKKMRGLAATSSVSAFLGVTEPAIFGVNIRYRYPFIFGMIGSAIGGVLLTMNNVQATSIGVGGVPGFLSIFPNKWGVFFIGMAIVLVVPFVLTVLFGRAKMRKEDRNESNENVAEPKAATSQSASAVTSSTGKTDPNQRTHSAALVGDEAVNTLEIMAPLTGQAVSLEQVPDPAFAEKQMGEGVAIEPSGNVVVAPFDAQVAHVIKSKHAVILEHASGLQVLIHVGINTVSLKGEGFNMHVEAGEHVKAGQKLLEFDRKVIEDAGYPLITPIIIPDGQDMVERVEVTTGDVTSNQNGVLKVHLKG
ncbi:PTS system trehalose-specific EIIBC component [Paenibacillus sp. SAF-068]|uniref:PTS system trehalose-specific EIIBC component n=1 Tax=Paenibacillus sp. SAF-068 TaxID=3436864 RepID=UPI003F7D8FF6